MQQAPILLTPGPLTTSLATRTAMLTDWGSWDGSFNALTASVCADLLSIANGKTHHCCIPLQGSGTFAVEAALGTLVPRTGKILVLENGAYGQRMSKIARAIGRDLAVLSWPDGVAVDAQAVKAKLQSDPTITQIGLIHCETATGLLNPLPEIARIANDAGCELIVDAMSSFGALDIDVEALNLCAVIAASGKCLEGVPGMGFVIAKTAAIALAHGNSPSLALDLADQFEYLQRTGQWRFTPPTHVVAALRAALDQYLAEGGRATRLARYISNAKVLIERLKSAGLKLFLNEKLQAPIILTFHAPAHPDYQFAAFYAAMRERGFVLYPGKLTQIETFRVGCIGAIDSAQLEQAAHAIIDVLTQLNWLTPAAEKNHA
ncbi:MULTISPECIES: 2-aminoethylphosphonate--pyruvate transaminase [Deefgea]|uniref:2-aminoethylphosphonate--pyruvate transaminase n=1 Tax=Deefgea chitinilytica TaxID=570276 RepID=A0ABS2CAZ4_9NEIS|nr:MULTISPECIES: 2-aminoethylphosphonate--pyruvate transaminase [Deefgea]MBM5571305.1 2-aminoethylphosphonate--pyruvate transaminase [Deefgea chitinilytica]MBM9888537.1 2-aminoethylphosphonate--pyruvate transaminase [Deefgea sp. CFH1-16]